MTRETRSGLILGIAAYVTWGILPLYLRLLHDVPAPQILAHRVVWSLLLLGAVVVALRRVGAIRTAARGRTLLWLCASAGLIAVNWLVYIWSVGNGHVLEASLGYFINPLVNVALAVAVLGEKVRRWQAVAIGIAAAGVIVMAVSGGSAIWISITLALSFGTYGLIRKMIAIDALGGLAVETLLLTPVCLIVILTAGNDAAFGKDVRIDLLLILAGAVTAAPLLMFSAAARKLRYTTMGLLQYIAPTLQFLQAVLLFDEPLRQVHLVTFGLIWIGCAVYAWDSVRASRPKSQTISNKPAAPIPPAVHIETTT